MTALRHYAHLTDASIRSSAVTQHRASLFPYVYHEKTSDQAITGATPTDITSLTALSLPVLTTVSSRKFRVSYAVHFMGNAAGIIASLNVHSGSDGDLGDTIVRSRIFFIPTGAVFGHSETGVFQFTPSADAAVKLGLATTSLGNNYSVSGASAIVSSVLIEEVP